MIEFVVNGKEAWSELPADTPLLWVIREELGLTGTKFGCGIAECGACTVHLDGQPVRSCVTPISSVAGKAVTTSITIPVTSGTLTMQLAAVDKSGMESARGNTDSKVIGSVAQAPGAPTAKPTVAIRYGGGSVLTPPSGGLGTGKP